MPQTIIARSDDDNLFSVSIESQTMSLHLALLEGQTYGLD